MLGQRRREDAPRASTLRADIPPALDDLIADLLARDPNARPFDAAALLARLEGALDREVPPFLPSEALAAAEGGPLAGREAPLGRFRESVERLPVCCKYTSVLALSAWDGSGTSGPSASGPL